MRSEWILVTLKGWGEVYSFGVYKYVVMNLRVLAPHSSHSYLVSYVTLRFAGHVIFMLLKSTFLRACFNV
jgi:hypothetical protein